MVYVLHLAVFFTKRNRKRTNRKDKYPRELSNGRQSASHRCGSVEMSGELCECVGSRTDDVSHISNQKWA